jgi:HTH-type transcriptional regulator/antitoxin HigA
MTRSPARLSEYQSLLVQHSPTPIVNERDYKRALKQLDRLMVPHPSRAKARLIDLLSTLIADYEAKRYPATTPRPHELLAHLIEARGVSQADVAHATRIPRSTISAVLAGRRKISKANVVKLAKFFQISPNLFLEAST